MGTIKQPLLLISLGMVINGSSTKLFAGPRKALLAVPRLGNVRLRLHFLRRGTSGALLSKMLILNFFIISFSCFGQKCDTTRFDGFLVLSVDTLNIPRYNFVNYFYERRTTFSDLDKFDANYPINMQYVYDTITPFALVNLGNCTYSSSPIHLNYDDFCFDTTYQFVGFKSRVGLKRVKGIIIGPYILNINHKYYDVKSFVKSRTLHLPKFRKNEKNRQVLIYKFINMEFISNELSYTDLLKLLNR